MRRLFLILSLFVLACVVWAGTTTTGRHWTYGCELLIAGLRCPSALLPAALPGRSELGRLRISSSPGKPKIIYAFNPDDDLAAIRRAGFTHVLVSYLQGMPDEAQRRKLNELRQHGLKVIYRLVDLVDRDRRAGNDALVQHTVRLLRDHPALAAWQTFEETNLPAAPQIAEYRKIKQWDPDHAVITVITNEYSPGWYQRTYSDDAQDIVMIDYYPYKRRYNGWVFIPGSMVALRATQKRPVPIIPIIQASSSAGVSSAENTFWPPPGGLEKQLNLWWSLGADAGAACWLWRGSKEYPFVGIADPQAPPYALPETKALLARIPDGELPFQTVDGRRQTVVGRSHLSTVYRLPSTVFQPEIPAVRTWQPHINYLKNSGFERGLHGWSGYGEAAGLTEQAYAGTGAQRRWGAARLVNAGTPKPMGVGQETDLLVRPNETATLSCYYRILRPTTGLQWMIGTTAYPQFGAAAFLENQERLPAGEWQRASISVTNTTGAPQRITGVSVISNRFTGEALLDDFQLELAPRATPYIDGTASQPTRLVYDLSSSTEQAPTAMAHKRHRRATRARLSSSLIPHPSSLIPSPGLDPLRLERAGDAAARRQLRLPGRH